MADKSINAEKKGPTPEEVRLEKIKFRGAQLQLLAVSLTATVAILGAISSLKFAELALPLLFVVMVLALVSLASIVESEHFSNSNSSVIDWVKALNDFERLRAYARLLKTEYGIDLYEPIYNDRLLTLHYAALIEGKKDLAAALIEKGKMGEEPSSKRTRQR